MEQKLRYPCDTAPFALNYTLKLNKYIISLIKLSYNVKQFIIHSRNLNNSKL